MKKLALLLAVALTIVALTASPAFAAKLRVSASARQPATHKVVFTAKLSRPGRVKITVYRRGHTVRKLSAHRSGKSYTANWTGSTVTAGTYSYKVTAVASSRTKVTRGKIVVVTTPAPSGSASGSGRWVGVYEPGCPADLSDLTTLESQIATKAAVLNFYISDSESFPLSRVQNAAAHGSTPLITLELWSTQTGGVSALLSGSDDVYLSNFADAAKAYGGTVWLRPFHEMNGNWYPWCGTVGGNSPAQVVAAWKHVHDIFAARGATNVKFVWCVNNDSVPDTSANAIKSYWPGDAYVDYVSIDGYNFGTYASWSSWRPFGSVIGAAYTSVTALTGKPLFLAETACVEQGGSKASWIADMFSSISSKYTRITGVCWFDQLKGEDWRIASSSASVAAFKAAIAQGY